MHFAHGKAVFSSLRPDLWKAELHHRLPSVADRKSEGPTHLVWPTTGAAEAKGDHVATWIPMHLRHPKTKRSSTGWSYFSCSFHRDIDKLNGTFCQPSLPLKPSWCHEPAILGPRLQLHPFLSRHGFARGDPPHLQCKGCDCYSLPLANGLYKAVKLNSLDVWTISQENMSCWLSNIAHEQIWTERHFCCRNNQNSWNRHPSAMWVQPSPQDGDVSWSLPVSSCLAWTHCRESRGTATTHCYVGTLVDVGSVNLPTSWSPWMGVPRQTISQTLGIYATPPSTIQPCAFTRTQMTIGRYMPATIYVVPKRSEILAAPKDVLTYRGESLLLTV